VSDENCTFSWRSDQDAIVLPSQQAVAVYLNDAGAVVVRQEGHPYDDEDSVIIIQAVNADAVAKAITARAAESLAQSQPERVLLVQQRHVGVDVDHQDKSANLRVYQDREPSLPLGEAAE
jgi:hypothetical protein